MAAPPARAAQPRLTAVGAVSGALNMIVIAVTRGVEATKGLRRRHLAHAPFDGRERPPPPLAAQPTSLVAGRSWDRARCALIRRGRSRAPAAGCEPRQL